MLPDRQVVIGGIREDIMSINTLGMSALARAKVNRHIVANRLFTIGYVEQELLRQRWLHGEPKPERLIVADYGDYPRVHPNRLHPYATWRYTDGKGRRPVMESWLGQYSLALDTNLIDNGVKYDGEIDFTPDI
jgi:hypothetical protein